MKRFVKAGLVLATALYLLILVNFILLKSLYVTDIGGKMAFVINRYYWDSHNFIPFKTITEYLLSDHIPLIIRIENLLGNIIGFVPFGFLLPSIMKKFYNWKRVLAATFALSLTFEMAQLVFRLGSFDVDDLILNTLGGVFGFFLYKLAVQIAKHLKNRLKVS